MSKRKELEQATPEMLEQKANWLESTNPTNDRHIAAAVQHLREAAKRLRESTPPKEP